MRIETITPVHIGTGEKYGPIDFFIKGRTLHRVDFNRFLSTLDDGQREQILRYLEEERYADVQRMFKDEHTRYTVELREGVIVRRIRDVREAFKTLSGEPYIPGSSIKGSIRSGLYLYYALPEHAKEAKEITGINIIEELRREVRESRGRINRKQIGETLEKKFFNVGRERDIKDAKFDLFRFVHVSDFMSEKATLHLDQIITYSKQRNGAMREKHFSIFAETAEGTFTGEIKLNTPALIRALNSSEYPNLEKKLRLFGLSKEDIFSEKVQKKFITTLIKRSTISRNISYLHDLDLMGNIQNASEVANYLMDNLPSAEGFIRLGFGVGTHFQGIIKAIEKRDPRFAAELISQFNRIPRRKGESGVIPPYPKTIELTSEGKPLGWMRMVIE